MELNLTDVIKLLVVFQATFFSIFLITIKNRKKPNYFIAFYLLLTAFNTAQTFASDYLLEKLGNLYVLLILTIFLIPPSVYFYIITSIDNTFRLTKKHLFHLSTFLIVSVLFILFQEQIKSIDIDSNVKLLYLNNVIFFIFYLQWAIYLLLAYKELKRYKNIYYQRFSNTDLKQFRYLNWLISILALDLIFSGIKNYHLTNNIEGAIVDYAPSFVLLLTLIFFCWIIYKGLSFPELFIESQKDLPKNNHEKSLTGNQKLKVLSSNSEIKSQIEKIKSHMKNEKPYLDANFSISDLSLQTEIPIRELSILINHHLNKHFFDFVNEYRIEKAKELLLSIDRKNHTILEILYEVGFNSKSSFNTAFKKQTQLTPTQYRRNNLKSAS